MNDFAIPTLALAAGILLGAMFFGGLWLSIRKGISARRPALWFFGSLVMRTGIVLTGFYLVSGGQWKRLFACLVGFILARLVMTRLVGLPVEQHNFPGKEAGHAS